MPPPAPPTDTGGMDLKVIKVSLLLFVQREHEVT